MFQGLVTKGSYVHQKQNYEVLPCGIQKPNSWDLRFIKIFLYILGLTFLPIVNLIS